MLRPMKNADRRPLPVRIFRFYYDGFREMRYELINHGLETQH